MLVQTPSKIFKNDFRNWNEGDRNAVAEILKNEEKCSSLIGLAEGVLEVDGELRLRFDGERTILAMPLYGEIIITDFYQPVTAGDSLLIDYREGQEIVLRNQIYYDRSDVLIFELEHQPNIRSFYMEQMDFTSSNVLFPVSQVLEIPNFTGIYDGRAQGIYNLKEPGKALFVMVLNGAFEFQNRLLENRDALLLWDIDNVDYEALSEDALLFIMEV